MCCAGCCQLSTALGGQAAQVRCTSNSVKQAEACKQHILLQIVCIPSQAACLFTLVPFQHLKAKKFNCLLSKARTLMQAPTLTFHDATASAAAGLRQTAPVRCGTCATPQTSTQPLHTCHCAPVQTQTHGNTSHQACTRNVPAPHLTDSICIA